MAAQYRGELPGVAMGKFPQEDPHRGRRVDSAERVLHATRTDHVQIIDAVGTRGHARDDGGSVSVPNGHPGSDPLEPEHHMLRAGLTARSVRPAPSPAPVPRTT